MRHFRLVEQFPPLLLAEQVPPLLLANVAEHIPLPTKLAKIDTFDVNAFLIVQFLPKNESYYVEKPIYGQKIHI